MNGILALIEEEPRELSWLSILRKDLLDDPLSNVYSPHQTLNLLMPDLELYNFHSPEK